MDRVALFWMLYCWAFALALFLVARSFFKYLLMPTRCTAQTTGKIIGYSHFTMGASGYAPPRVQYEVDGTTYVVRGPLYSSYRTVTYSAPWLRNRMRRPVDDKLKTDQVFRMDYDTNSAVSIKAPAPEMFPIGSTLPVFYDPAKPKLAYVERFPHLRWVFWLAFSFAVACFVTGIIFGVCFNGNATYVSPTGESVRVENDFFSEYKVKKVGESSFVVEFYGDDIAQGDIITAEEYESDMSSKGLTATSEEYLAKNRFELIQGELFGDPGDSSVWYGRSGDSYVRIYADEWYRLYAILGTIELDGERVAKTDTV
jgi:hypothetical protein